ncbi:HAMP domain-containing histidine kinase [Pseudohoeflea suaedae]|uniref:histidine kinase n=1 Tax=Pseudohoeflea suaedae TaxID=877384 RepID=A0A4R5PQN6_9HYPH|nr:HAMP domain-containing sensor histidine kinase [Pseudohoeflea suaedae]TDH39462.1 HAMP domain-containing histidine kinase [Pseudohoeflea suaedae]
MRFNSLTVRVLFFGSIWAAIGIVAIALVISGLYRNASERGFRFLLRANLNGIINAVSMDETGELSGSPQLGSLAYSRPDSGWYWIVDPIPPAGGSRLVSASLGGEGPAIPSVEEYPFSESYVRTYPATDQAGNELVVAETEVDLGPGAARIRVAGNLAVIENDISRFNYRLFLALGLFGIGSLIINGIAILVGLKPLDHARRALERIRAGQADRLTGDFPSEIAPLASEINQLIEMNTRVVERARKQVGNLAHSLKTPIAVLLNESREFEPEKGRLVRAQVDSMQAQVQTYLDRARIAAQRGSVLARADARSAIERMIRVMGKLNREVEFSQAIETAQPRLAVEQQDFEEALGNLMENAARFARKSVVVRVAPAHPPDGAAIATGWLAVSVEDDGPGLTEEERKEALKRGRRLDESRPGTGLGLSIVAEICSEYGGSFSLETSQAGGLAARMVLPGLQAEA